MMNKRTFRYLLFLVAVLLAVVVFFLEQPRVITSVAAKTGIDLHRVFSQPLVHLGEVEVTPILLLKVGLFFLVLLFVSRRVRRFLRRDVLPHTSLDLGQQDAMARITAYVIFLLGLVIGLQTMGVNLSSLLVLGGAVLVGQVDLGAGGGGDGRGAQAQQRNSGIDSRTTNIISA